MLSVMTATGVFVCGSIDMLAPCRTVWWITVCVGVMIRDDMISQECYTAGMMSSVQ